MLFLILILPTFLMMLTIPTVSAWTLCKCKTDGDVVSVGVSADGNYTVAGTDKGSVYLFDKAGSIIWRKSFTVGVRCVAVSGDGGRIVVGIDEYRRGSPDIYLLDNTGNIMWQRDLVEGGWPCDVAISPDATYLVAGDTANVVYFYDINGNRIWTYEAGGWVSAVSISSGGDYVAAGSQDERIYFFDKTGKQLWSYELDGHVDHVSVSPDGEYVAAPTLDELFLFDRNGSLLWKCAFRAIHAVSVSAHADRIAVGTFEKLTVIDRVMTVISTDPTPMGLWIKDVAITADGKFVAFGGDDDFVYFLEAGRPSTPSSITCEVSEAKIYLGESVAVSGRINPVHTGAAVTLTYTRPDAVNLTRTASTDQFNFYKDTFTPDKPGAWNVRASWMGDADHAGAESPPVSFLVANVSRPAWGSEITCDVSPKVILSGESVAVSGLTKPAHGGVPITLEYKLIRHDYKYEEKGFINVTKTVVTASDGSYNYTFTPEEIGGWNVKASWPGDLDHMGNESSTRYFAANPFEEITLSSATGLTLYWHQRDWYCLQVFPSTPPTATFHSSLNLSAPVSPTSFKTGFDPGMYWWMGLPVHQPYLGAHTGPLSSDTFIEAGSWSLTIWASGNEPGQHLVLEIYIWNEDERSGYTIESWGTGSINSTNPDAPIKLTFSVQVPSKVVPKGSLVGFLISVGPDSNASIFLDSTVHPSSLTIPPSRPHVRAESTISCSVTPLTIRVGEPVTVSGTISPPHGGVDVELTFTGKTKIVQKTVSFSDGSFSLVYYPEEAGAQSVSAQWSGEEDHYGAVSQPVYFKVETKEGLPTILIAGVVVTITIVIVAAIAARKIKRAPPPHLAPTIDPPPPRSIEQREQRE